MKHNQFLPSLGSAPIEREGMRIGGGSYCEAYQSKRSGGGPLSGPRRYGSAPPPRSLRRSSPRGAEAPVGLVWLVANTGLYSDGQTTSMITKCQAQEVYFLANFQDRQNPQLLKVQQCRMA